MTALGAISTEVYPSWALSLQRTSPSRYTYRCDDPQPIRCNIFRIYDNFFGRDGGVQ